METRTYRGFIREYSYGQDDDVLFIRAGAEEAFPFAMVVQEDFSDENHCFHARRYWGRELVDKVVTVRYWISDTQKTKEELKGDVVRKISGDIDAIYYTHYSEYTGYLWTDEECNIGGHNLLEELRSYVGKYIHLEIEVHE